MRRQLALTIVVGGLLLTGCGSQKAADTSPDLTPVAAVKAASTATKAMGTAKMTAGVSMTIGTKKIDFSMTGPMSLDGLQADLTGTIPGASLGAKQDIGIHEILDHGTIYLRYDAKGMPTTWFKIDAGSAMAKKATGLGSGPGVEEQLKQLSAMAAITKVGAETLDGVEVTHYKGTLDGKTLSTMMSGLGAGASAPTSVPVDLWIDGQGRMAQLRESLTMTMASHSVTAVVSMKLSNWGIPVSITAPKGAVDFRTVLGK